MDISSGRPSVPALLLQMRLKGVRLWTDNGRLRYQTSKGALSPADLETIRALRADIVEFFSRFEQSGAEPMQLESRSQNEPVPLTFTQQLWWRNCLNLGRNPGMRTVAAAVRLFGAVSIGLLQHVFAEVAQRHEALRTQIAAVDGIPFQLIVEPDRCPLQFVDVTHLPTRERTLHSAQILDRLVYEPISVSRGPLFAARLSKLGERDHLLAIAMDHIISDAVSVGILWREIFSAYRELAQGLPLSFANTAIQFADYAVWQHKSRAPWTQEHGTYWRTRLAGAKRVQLPGSHATRKTVGGKWRSYPVLLGTDLSCRLRALSRQQRTSIVMTVLTAYIALLLRWCDINDLVVAFITTGRLQPEVENTLGYFSAPLFLRAGLFDGDTFLDLLERVTAEYGTAYRHSDLGRVAAETPEPEFAWNPRFNWIPKELNAPTLDTTALAENAGFTVEPWPLDGLRRDDLEWGGQIELALSDDPDGIAGELIYRVDRYTSDVMECFARNVRLFAAEMARNPTSRVADVFYEQWIFHEASD
jgi:hypothetical protein